MTLRYLTAEQAARLLGEAWGRPVSTTTLRSYVARKKLRAIRRNATRSDYPLAEVEALAANPPRPGNHTGRPRRPKPQNATL